MHHSKIYQELKKRAISRSHFFGRKLIVVSIEDFRAYERHFRPSFNLLNRRRNFRTTSLFRHIHAIEKGDFVEFHFDYMNPDKGILCTVPHAVLDVIPYFLYFACTLQKPYTFSIDGGQK